MSKTLLKLIDVINILTRYDLEHCRFPHNYCANKKTEELNGLIMDDKKIILINKELGLEDMRETIIHELIHAKHYQIGDLRGFNKIEKHVQEETKMTYKKLYGVEP